MQSEMPGHQRGTTTSDKPDSVLARIMDTGEFSDLTFVCNGEEFKVHKAIVCTQSEPLKAAVQGGFLVRLKCNDLTDSVAHSSHAGITHRHDQHGQFPCADRETLRAIHVHGRL